MAGAEIIDVPKPEWYRQLVMKLIFLPNPGVEGWIEAIQAALDDLRSCIVLGHVNCIPVAAQLQYAEALNNLRILTELPLEFMPKPTEE